VKRFAKPHATDINQPEIVAALEKIGCMVWDIGRPVDLLVEFRGLYVVIEVKNMKGKNKLTDWQEKFFDKTKGPAFVVRDHVEAVMAVQRAWKKVTKRLVSD
jgi:hypothetical protein